MNMQRFLQWVAGWTIGGVVGVVVSLIVSAQPVVKLSVDPDVSQITLGAMTAEIFIIADISPLDGRWVWSCQGPGECLGNLTEDMGILYVPPTNLMEPLANVIITLTVTDSQNHTTVEHVSLTLQNAHPLPTPTLSATPSPTPTIISTPTPVPLLPQKTALLTMRSNVKGDTVWIDDKDYGPTRLDLELPLGKHTIRVEKAGCTPYQKTIDFQAKLTIRAVLTCPAWGNAVWDHAQWR